MHGSSSLAEEWYSDVPSQLEWEADHFEPVPAKPRRQPVHIYAVAFSEGDGREAATSDTTRMRFWNREHAQALLTGDNLSREVARQRAAVQTRQLILLRLSALHSAALDEDMTIGELSERDLRHLLLNELRPSRRPAISLLESGNLRALWKDASGQQVGLQFLGEGWIQYVIFSRSAEYGVLESSVGRKRMSEVLALLNPINLKRLLFADV